MEILTLLNLVEGYLDTYLIKNIMNKESFLEIYQNALSQTLEAIDKVNGCLYNGKSISSLEMIFPNISYDTGCPLSLGLDMKYVREINNKTKAYQRKK